MHDRHYGVTFQNGAKETLGMLDAVTFQDAQFRDPKTDAFPKPTAPYHDSHRLDQGTGSPTIRSGSVSFPDTTNLLCDNAP